MATDALSLGYSANWRNHTKDDLKRDILYSLGAPAIKVNLTDTQIDGCIAYALKKMWRYHPDFSFENYYLKKLTPEEASRRWFEIPERIDAVTEILPQGIAYNSMNFGTWQYQLNRDVFMSFSSMTNIQLVDYVLLQQKITSINSILGNNAYYKHVRLQNRVLLFFPVHPDDIIAMKVIENIDPDDPYQKEHFNSALLWDSEALKALSIAQAKQTWGNILRRYQGATLPGGVVIDGQSMIDEGRDEEAQIMAGLQQQQIVDIRFG